MFGYLRGLKLYATEVDITANCFYSVDGSFIIQTTENAYIKLIKYINATLLLSLQYSCKIKSNKTTKVWIVTNSFNNKTTKIVVTKI